MADSATPDAVFAVGRQVLADFKGCQYAALADTEHVRAALLSAAYRSGATVVSESFRKFEPHGVSGFIVISESHFSVHTWPEYSYAAVDIFTCGNTIDFDEAIAALREAFGAIRVDVSANLHRGTGPLASALSADDAANEPYVLSWDNLYKGNNAWGMNIEVELIGTNLPEREDLAGFLCAACDELGLKRDSSPIFPPQANEVMMIATLFFGGGHMRLYGRAPSKTRYLELLSTSYIDPRIVGRVAFALAHGTGYRLRVSLRT